MYMKNLTICIPTYKRLDFLKNLVESIPEEYPICISDNGRFVNDSFINRKNVKIHHLDNVIPLFENWNNAIEMVETEWFMIPGDDDVVLIDKLPLVEKYLENYNDCAFLAFAYETINEYGKKTKEWHPSRTGYFDKIEGFRIIERGVPYRCPAIVINTAKSRSIGNYDTDFSYTAGDSLYIQRLALEYPSVVIDEVIGQYRVWDNNYTNQKLFSIEWFDQIQLWQNKLRKFLIEKEINGIDMDKLCDLVIFDNLTSAILSNKSATIYDRLKFVNHIGWPKRIGTVNLLRLIRHIFS